MTATDPIRVLISEVDKGLAVLTRIEEFFEFNYDWDRLEYLVNRLDQVRPLVRSDLDRFRAFLVHLASG